MEPSADIFNDLGCEPGCKRLATAFYAGLAGDPLLRPLFPGKSLRCAIEEFAAFLVQFFDGDEAHSQYRWRLGLNEAHRRLRLTEAHRQAWVNHMTQALAECVQSPAAREALAELFDQASHHIVPGADKLPPGWDLLDRWQREVELDELTAAIEQGSADQAILLAERQRARKSVYIGVLARMIATHRRPFVAFALQCLTDEPDLVHHRYNGRSLLHHAAGCGSLEVVQALLKLGVDPNELDSGGHAPLYRSATTGVVGNSAGVVSALAAAGGDVNFVGGVTRCTALHQAARRGNVAVIKTLIALGANPNLRDKSGFTPRERAVNCRKPEAAKLLAAVEKSLGAAK